MSIQEPNIEHRIFELLERRRKMIGIHPLASWEGFTACQQCEAIIIQIEARVNVIGQIHGRWAVIGDTYGSSGLYDPAQLRFVEQPPQTVDNSELIALLTQLINELRSHTNTGLETCVVT